MILNGKKIVFICMKSFNIEGFIVSGLVELGAEVRFFDERPDNSIVGKVVLRAFPQWIKKRIKAHYEAILAATETYNTDAWFFVRGELVPEWFVQEIRNRNPNAKLIFYTADSVGNNPKAIEKIGWFDKSFSFDPKDAKHHGFTYLPLFYDPYFEENKMGWKDRKYAISFLGTLHSDRQWIVSKIVQQFPKESKYIFYFSHAWWVSLYLMRYGLKFTMNQLKYVSTKSLSREQMREVFLQSKVVIDVHHPGQTGLTLRTIEALAAGCKLITTNSQIKNHPFYNSNTICIIDRKTCIIPSEFLETPPESIARELRYLKLDNWLEEVFSTLN